MPLIRLSIEGMRHEVVHALARHHQEVEDLVNKETARAVEAMDWSGEIQRIVVGEIKAAVAKSVEAYFKFGDGRKYVDGVVAETLSLPDVTKLGNG